MTSQDPSPEHFRHRGAPRHPLGWLTPQRRAALAAVTGASVVIGGLAVSAAVVGSPDRASVPATQARGEASIDRGQTLTGATDDASRASEAPAPGAAATRAPSAPVSDDAGSTVGRLTDETVDGVRALARRAARTGAGALAPDTPSTQPDPSTSDTSSTLVPLPTLSTTDTPSTDPTPTTDQTASQPNEKPSHTLPTQSQGHPSHQH